MLEDFLKKEIVSVENKAKADIGAVKYVGGLVDEFSGKFKGYSREEVYCELKDLIDKIYKTYDYKDSLLLDNARNYRKKEEMKKGVILGLEEISGDPKVLDGAFDIGEVLSLTEKGKNILNGYRLARGELTLENERKELHKSFSELSKGY